MATIRVCNQFSHPIRLAFAYETENGWASDGWTVIAPSTCEIDSKHPELTSFYYRAESDVYDGHKKATWGNDRKFSVKDGDFKFDNAEAGRSRVVKFNGPDSFTDPATVVTLTFQPDLKVTFSVPNENAGAPSPGPSSSDSAAGTGQESDADFQACKKKLEEESATACMRAIASGKFSGNLLAMLHTNQGLWLAERKMYDPAITAYNKAIAIDPRLALAYENRGRAYYYSRNFNQAMSDLDKAIDLDPSPAGAGAHYVRGLVYETKGNHKRAIAELTKVIELDPQYAWAYIDRGKIYYERNDRRRAIADIDKAIEIDPNNPAAYCNRGVAHADQKEYEEAIADYTKAIELDPNLAMSYLNRAVSNELSGRVGAAIADYTRTLEVDPDSEQSKRALERLQGFYFNPREKVQ